MDNSENSQEQLTDKNLSTLQPFNPSTNNALSSSEYKVNLHMNGMFSVYNVLASVTAALAMGIDIKVALKALENVHGVAGRFEVVVKKPLVIALLKKIANNNDVVVIAGKGHEDYQILKDKTIHFDDREEARKIFEGSVI